MEDFDMERLEEAGRVVKLTDYEKRIKVLLFQLPEVIVKEIEEDKLCTKNLKDKLKKLEFWKLKAYELLKRQQEFQEKIYTEEDIIEQYNNHYKRVFNALKLDSLKYCFGFQ